MSPLRAAAATRALRRASLHAHPPPALDGFAADVRAGLLATPKTLPSMYLYDALGSALFEAITALPEYGLTRAEERILARHSAEIARILPRGVAVVELGAGSGRKTIPLLDAILARQSAVSYTSIDLSAAAQESCARLVSGRPGIRLRAIQAPFLEGLGEAVASRSPGTPLLVLFLGSTLGNFGRAEQMEFLGGLRAGLRDADALFLGADLVKPVPRLLAAYDDPLGVTAAFDRNLLARINRELDADFDLAAFRHEARWSEAGKRVEMHLVSTRPQLVRIPRARCIVELERGETIWTESSHKFTPADLAGLAASSGFGSAALWIDEEWGFADCLWRVGRDDS